MKIKSKDFRVKPGDAVKLEARPTSVSHIILDVIKDLKMAYPEITAARKQELASIREQL